MRFICRFLLITMIWLVTHVPVHSQAPPDSQDSSVLVDFYNSTGGSNWLNNNNWLNGPVYTWSGAMFNFSTGHVNWMGFNNNQLVGHIPSSIGGLSELQYLGLAGNELTGNIPPSIGSLHNLYFLDFSGCPLTGSIPSSIGNLDNLQQLDIRFTQLSGNIPSTIGNLSNLESIRLDYNQLTGSIPSTIGNLSNLKYLQFNGNQLTGAIPSTIGNLTDLEEILLQGNQLTGDLPSSIGNLANLQALDISNNQIGGSLSSLSALTNLQYLDVSNNRFTFEGMEPLVQQGNIFYYGNQASIHIHKNDSILSVSAGGTLSNNTYMWRLNGQLVATKTGDSTYVAISPGNYQVSVSNSVVTGLWLFSDMVEYIGSFKVIDPNPSFISTNGTLNTNVTALDISRTIEGVATDGITKVLLYLNSTQPIRFWISNSNDGSLSSLLNQSTTSNEIIIQPVNGKVVAIYNAPDGFGNSLNNQTLRQVLIKTAFLSGIDSTMINLKLITPPVVMIHGMWSDPAIWNEGGFVDFLRTRGFTEPVLADYSERSDATFNPSDSESIYGISAVRTAVLQSLINYKNLKIAVSQVDVVAHSLGGLMARSFSQKPYFIQKGNYYKGYIHKLITLGTPHKGSPFGPELWQNKDNLLWLPGTSIRLPITVSALLLLNGKKIGSCHRDFGIQSNGINALSQTLPFKTFSVTADYSGQTAGYNIMDRLSRIAFNKSLNDVMGSRCNGNPPLINDLIVPLNSQRGFVSGGKDTLFTNIAHSSPGDATETNSPFVQLKVTRLLLSNNASEFGTGFPAASSIPLDCNAAMQRTVENTNTTRQVTIGDQAIQINSPARGASYQDGSSANITLSFQPVGTAAPISSLFIVDGIGWYAVPDNPPYSVNITLPANGPVGKVRIIALSVDTSGLRLADTSFINIIPNGTLDSIVVDPDSIRLDSAMRERPVYVRGYFNNGSVTRVADLTDGGTGTVYLSQSNNVFSVNENGLVRAIAVGTDTLIITYGNKLLKVPVVVDSNFQAATFYSNFIDFPVITDKTLGDDPFGLNAVASSGENVVFAVVSGPATIQNGILSMDTTGQVTIKASRSGNAYFTPAADVFRSFCVKPVKPVISRDCNTLSSNIANGNQWYKNGIEISGATNQNFIITDTGTYTAKVTSNNCLSVASDLIIVGINPVNNWTGAVSTAWEDANNWSCGSIPDSNTNVIINSAVSRYPEVNSNVSCRRLTVQPGATLLVKPGYRIDITGTDQ